MAFTPRQMQLLLFSLTCYLMAYLYVFELLQYYETAKMWTRMIKFFVAVMIWFFYIGGIRLLNQMDSTLQKISSTNSNKLISCLARFGSAVSQLTGDIVFPTCSTFLPDRIPTNGGVELCSWLMGAIFFASLAMDEYRDYGFRNAIQSICLSILYVTADNKIASLFIVTTVCCIQQAGDFIAKEVEIWKGLGAPQSIRNECLSIVEEWEKELAAGGGIDPQICSKKLDDLKKKLMMLE